MASGGTSLVAAPLPIVPPIIQSSKRIATIADNFILGFAHFSHGGRCLSFSAHHFRRQPIEISLLRGEHTMWVTLESALC